jgi:DNA repair exonuclease SbcCD ATPase subunit
MVVEVEFSVSSKKYKIVRGIKPNIFEIYCDGEMINQDAAAKDYQKVLEQQILRLNYKTFTQVVILGSASFVPFMQLPAWQRREVIEDILDIGVFSTMGKLDIRLNLMISSNNCAFICFLFINTCLSYNVICF